MYNICSGLPLKPSPLSKKIQAEHLMWKTIVFIRSNVVSSWGEILSSSSGHETCRMFSGGLSSTVNGNRYGTVESPQALSPCTSEPVLLTSAPVTPFHADLGKVDQDHYSINATH